MNLFRVFSSFSSVLIVLTHLGKFPLHRNVVSGKSGSEKLAWLFIIEMLISRALQNSRHSRNSRGMGASFRGNDFSDGLSRQALAVIGQ